MATSNVNVNVATEIREFPLDVQPTGFLFELFDKNDFKLSFVENAVPTATFPLVPQGENYTIKCTRNGVTAEVKFTVPLTVNEIAVPVTITVSFD